MDEAPRNPLFATDEDLYMGIDPRVNVHLSSGVGKMGRPGMAFARAHRQQLLALVQARDIDAVVYSDRMLRLVHGVLRTVLCSIKFVGGALEDRRRESLTPSTPGQVLGAVRAVVDTLIGPLMRYSPAEMQYMNVQRYGVRQPYNVLHNHDYICGTMIKSLLNGGRLLRLETQRSLSASARPGTLQLLAALSFGEGLDTKALEERTYLLAPLRCPADTLRRELAGPSLSDPGSRL